MHSVYQFTKFVSVAGLAWVTGCATGSDPASKLATTTGANAARLGAQLQSFADHQQAMAKLRADTMAYTVSEMGEANYRSSRTLEALRLAGQSDALVFYTNLITSSETLAALRESLPVQQAQVESLILNAQKQLSPPTKQLNAVSEQLAALGKNMSFSDWLTFLYGYGEDVDTAFDQQKQLLTSAETNAVSLNSQLTNNIALKQQ
jgi:hypothetical protein